MRGGLGRGVGLGGLGLSLGLAMAPVAAAQQWSPESASTELTASLRSGGVAPYLPVDWADALAQAEHPGDFTRILADGPPGFWDAAAVGLLGEKEWVSGYALPVVLQRLGALGPEARFRVSAAVARESKDPRALPLLARLAFEPHALDDPSLQALAAERFEDPGWRAALERHRRGQEPFPAPTPTPPPVGDPPPAPAAPEVSGAPSWLLLGLILVSGWLGLVLFLWGFRLLRLRRLVQGLPPSTARSVAVGQVALQGEAQPLGGESLRHPDTGEVCLFYQGADRTGSAPRFCVVDETGRIAVDPSGAALLSADGVIVPGERVHLIGEARRARPSPGERAGEITVVAPAFARSAFQKTAQLLVGSVMGGLFGRGSARMLFTDPLRCFWVWDDLQATPFTSARETAWLVGAFLMAGAWVLVFLAAATALLDR